MADYRLCSRHSIRRQLHYERKVIILEEAAHHLGGQYCQNYSEGVESEKNQSRMMREEGTGNENIYRHSSRT